jgi:hypothetical protein
VCVRTCTLVAGTAVVAARRRPAARGRRPAVAATLVGAAAVVLAATVVAPSGHVPPGPSVRKTKRVRGRVSVCVRRRRATAARADRAAAATGRRAKQGGWAHVSADPHSHGPCAHARIVAALVRAVVAAARARVGARKLDANLLAKEHLAVHGAARVLAIAAVVVLDKGETWEGGEGHRGVASRRGGVWRGPAGGQAGGRAGGKGCWAAASEARQKKRWVVVAELGVARRTDDGGAPTGRLAGDPHVHELAVAAKLVLNVALGGTRVQVPNVHLVGIVELAGTCEK